MISASTSGNYGKSKKKKEGRKNEILKEKSKHWWWWNKIINIIQETNKAKIWRLISFGNIQMRRLINKIIKKK